MINKPSLENRVRKLELQLKHLYIKFEKLKSEYTTFVFKHENDKHANEYLTEMFKEK